MSAEIAPNSIVHQIIRMEKKMVKMVKNGRRRRSSRKSKGGLDMGSCHSASSNASSYYTGSESFASNGFHRKDIDTHIDDNKSVGTFGSNDPDEQPTELPSIDIKKRPPLQDKEFTDLTVSFRSMSADGDYRTINQNEFFTECMINGENKSCVIHFFNSESEKSNQVDDALEDISKMYGTFAKFLRIDGAWTQFISAKLGITKFPTVIVIRNKVLVDRMVCADMESIEEKEMERWVLPLIAGV